MKGLSVVSREEKGTWWVRGRCVSSPSSFCRLGCVTAEEKSRMGSAWGRLLLSIVLRSSELLLILLRKSPQGVLIDAPALLDAFRSRL